MMCRQEQGSPREVAGGLSSVLVRLAQGATIGEIALTMGCSPPAVQGSIEKALGLPRNVWKNLTDRRPILAKAAQIFPEIRQLMLSQEEAEALFLSAVGLSEGQIVVCRRESEEKEGKFFQKPLSLQGILDEACGKLGVELGVGSNGLREAAQRACRVGYFTELLALPLDGKKGAGEQLTLREMEILVRLVQGWSNKRIADELGSSYHTIKNQIYTIFGKLGVADRTQATLRVFETDFLNIRILEDTLGTKVENLARLSDEEYATLRLLAQGLSTQGVACKLRYSPQTIKNRLGGVFKKLGVSNRVEAVGVYLLSESQGYPRKNSPENLFF